MNTALKYQETTWNNIGTQISEDMFPSEAYRLISDMKDNGRLVILDVCTPKEFTKVHLENAINLNFFSKTFKSQLNTLDKNMTYFVYCKVGGRSKLAQKQMEKRGFREVYNIVGGTLLWEEEELPFASGLEGPSRFALCPVFMSIILVKKVRKLLQSGYRSLFTGGETASWFKNKLNYRLGDQKGGGGHGWIRVLRLFVLVDIPSCHDSPLLFHDEGTKEWIDLWV